MAYSTKAVEKRASRLVEVLLTKLQEKGTPCRIGKGSFLDFALYWGKCELLVVSEKTSRQGWSFVQTGALEYVLSRHYGGKKILPRRVIAETAKGAFEKVVSALGKSIEYIRSAKVAEEDKKDKEADLRNKLVLLRTVYPAMASQLSMEHSTGHAVLRLSLPCALMEDLLVLLPQELPLTIVDALQQGVKDEDEE